MLELDAVRGRLECAYKMVRDLSLINDAPEKRHWTLSVPARPHDDPDLVIGASLEDVSALCTEVEELRGENKRLKEDCHYYHAGREDAVAEIARLEEQIRQIRDVLSLKYDLPNDVHNDAF